MFRFLMIATVCFSLVGCGVVKESKKSAEVEDAKECLKHSRIAVCSDFVETLCNKSVECLKSEYPDGGPTSSENVEECVEILIPRCAADVQVVSEQHMEKFYKECLPAILSQSCDNLNDGTLPEPCKDLL